MCPKEIWERSLKTYNPEDETRECEIFSDVLDSLGDLEDINKPFDFNDILSKCKQDFEPDFPDIEDFSATIKEIVLICLEDGYMPKQFSDITYLTSFALTGTDQ